jgi:hypothetical protein
MMFSGSAVVRRAALFARFFSDGAKDEAEDSREDCCGHD